MRRKLEGWLCPIGGGGAGSPSNSVAWAEAYLRTKLHLDPFSRLTTTDMADFWWEEGCVPLGAHVWSWVPIKHNLANAQAYLRAKFHLDPSSRLATVHQRHRQTRQDNGPIA